MTSTFTKKRSERFFLERFVEAAGLTLEIIEEREAPDFLACVENRVVGIEVTRLFVEHDANGPLPQAQESISDQIIRTARRLYESKGGSPVHASIYFSHPDLRRVDRSQLAERLASFVLGLALVAGQRSDWRGGLGDVVLDEHIGFLHALGVPGWNMAHWGVARAGWVAPLTADALQGRINNKAQRLVEYQGAVSENWLLIVADGTKPSQLFEVRADFDAKKVSSPFARTFFYAHPDRAVVELRG